MIEISIIASGKLSCHRFEAGADDGSRLQRSYEGLSTQ